MKKTLILAFALCLSLSAASQNETKLPDPQPAKASQMTLMQALQNRHSVREYADKPISDQTLSTLLWAACGYNRPEAKRITAPSAINAQDIVVYVCTAKGAYRYNPDGNSLVEICKDDLRPAVASRQDFAKTAPVCLVLVSDLNKFRSPHMELGAMDAGFVSENICLAATALGLATVPRATMDKEALTKALGLKENQIPLLNNPVGWPK
jgi:SagB-type dehydrogenase family enzyme